MNSKLVVAAFAAVGLGGSIAHSTPMRGAAAAPVPSVFDRLHDSGVVAGMPGWSVALAADATRCGGFDLVTTRGSAAGSPDDQPLVTVFALTFPTGLDFSDAHAKVKQASIKKFDTWVSTLQSIGLTATTHYQDELTTGDPTAKLHAVARIAQIQLRFASVLARGAIPKDVRTGQYAAEKVAAYCGRMAEVAKPILARGEATLASCAATTLAGSTDWAATYCAGH